MDQAATLRELAHLQNLQSEEAPIFRFDGNLPLEVIRELAACCQLHGDKVLTLVNGLDGESILEEIRPGWSELSFGGGLLPDGNWDLVLDSTGRVEGDQRTIAVYEPRQKELPRYSGEELGILVKGVTDGYTAIEAFKKLRAQLQGLNGQKCFYLGHLVDEKNIVKTAHRGRFLIELEPGNPGCRSLSLVRKRLWEWVHGAGWVESSRSIRTQSVR